MAKLSDEILITILSLEKQLIQAIDEAAKVEAFILEEFGETEITLPILEELQNVKERLLEPYSRLCNLLPRIAQYQPIAPRDVLELLYRTIEQAQAARDASVASVQEVKQDLDLL